MYHRYFKVTSGPLIDELNRIRASRDAAFEQWKVFCEEIGANQYLLFSNGSFGGFMFPSPPDMNVWKKNKRDKGYTPRKTSPAGKELWKKIQSMPIMEPFDNALVKLDLPVRFPVIFHGQYAYRCTLCGFFKEGVFFVKVPWKDVDPKELEQYKIDRDAGTRGNCEYEHLLWTPRESMTEVKEWEFLKWQDENGKTTKEREDA